MRSSLPTLNTKENCDINSSIVDEIQEIAKPKIVGKNKTIKYTNYIGSSVRHSMARRDYFK